MSNCLVLSWFYRHADEGRGSVGEFGDKFRKTRESKELSLDDVSNVTKISSRMLQAIEEERFDQLPGGVFNKGFIRAYAKHLGLDSEDAVSDYLACLRQAQVDAHEVWEPKPAASAHPPVSVVAAPSKPAKTQPPVQVEELPGLQLPRAEHVHRKRRDFTNEPSSGISWTLIAFAAVVLIATFFLWTRHSRNAHTAAAKSTIPATTTSSAPVVASAQVPSTPSAATRPGPANTLSHSSTPNTASPQPAKPSASIPPTASTAPTTPADNPEEKVVEKSDVTIRSFGESVAPTSEKPAASLSLVIRATETSWISVTSDGQLVTQETLIAPAHTTVHASREIVARIGNAAGVTFLWNGEELPAQGAEAEAKTLVFDAQGMHELPQQPPPQN